MAISKDSSNLQLNHYSSDSVSKSLVNEKQSYIIAKRTLDIFGAGLGLIFLLPLFIIIAVCIKIEDPKGPIIFKQRRAGKNGKEFSMYKFRSMVTNAEDLLDSLMHRNETTGAMFKMKKDPRVTKIGKLTRKTSIDELPQLLNVLKGDMSLVGPRPPLLREVKQYSNYDRQRLLIMPGCTGLWQVSGRSEVGFEEMVELDLEYLRKRSFLYDCTLILKTTKVLLASRNAF